MPEEQTKQMELAEIEKIVSDLVNKIDRIEKVLIRAIGQLEGHKHLPDGAAALPLGQ